jgi:hypothetical protein
MEKNTLKLTLLEQETIFNWNREEKEASIYTCEPSLKAKLKKLAAEYPEIYKLYKEDKYSAEYIVPKNLITVRTPRAKKELSEEQRKALSERAKKNFGKK